MVRLTRQRTRNKWSDWRCAMQRRRSTHVSFGAPQQRLRVGSRRLPPISKTSVCCVALRRGCLPCTRPVSVISDDLSLNNYIDQSMVVVPCRRRWKGGGVYAVECLSFRRVVCGGHTMRLEPGGRPLTTPTGSGGTEIGM